MDWVHAEHAKGGHAKFAKCHAKSAEVGGVANCVAGGSRRARKGGSRKVREVSRKVRRGWWSG